MFFVLLGVWLLLWAAVAVWPASLAPLGDGFTRGSNRVAAALWLVLPTVPLSVAIAVLRPRGGSWRLVGLAPLAVTGLMGMGVVLAALFVLAG